MKISVCYKKFFAMILMLFICMYNCAFADDTEFGGEGAAPMPIEQTNVKMLGEKIVITGFDITNPQGYWQYNCLYHFQNTTSKPLQFLMGFPFPVYNEIAAYAIPAGIKLKSGDALVYEFKAAINGKPVAVKPTQLSANVAKNLNYNNAYEWQVKFLPNQLLNITHEYITGVTTNVLGETWVQFVLRTGGLWQSGIIGKVQVYIKPNVPTRLCSDVYQSAPKDIAIYQTPPGVTVTSQGKYQEYAWDINNLHPTQDVKLCLLSAKGYVSKLLSSEINFGSDEDEANSLSKYSCAQLRILRNLNYAQYGKTFQDKTLQNYFNQQWWYESNPNYSDKNLTENDMQIIAIILKAETAKQCEANE